MLPSRHKSMASSVTLGLQSGGGAFSSMLAAFFISRGALSKVWEVASIKFSSYDTVLFVRSIVVFILVVSLGLVPSMFHRAETLPSGRAD